MRRQPGGLGLAEPALDQPIGAPFLAAFEGNLGEPFERQDATGNGAGFQQQVFGILEQRLGRVEFSRKQRHFAEQQVGQTATGHGVGLGGDGQQLARLLGDPGMAMGAAEAELGQAEMAIEDVAHESRARPHPLDELGAEQFRPALLHIGRQAEQRAGLADFPRQVGAERLVARLAGDLAGPVELTALQVHQAPGERGADAVGRVRLLRAGKRQSLLVERDRRCTGPHPEFGVQIVAQLVELADRLDPVAGIEGPLHQGALRLLVGGIVGDQPLPQPAGAEQLGVALLQLVARAIEPIDIDVIGQQLAAIEVGGPLELGRVAGFQRRLGGSLELLGVDTELGPRSQ